MKQFNIYPPFNAIVPKVGQLLIAEPLLNDDHFTRSVILVCEHTDDGSVGFVLNQKSDINLHSLFINMIEVKPALYKGGPVKNNELHLLHRVPHILGAGKQIAKDIYWGATFDNISQLELSGLDIEKDIRLFLGYSGWAPGQLEQEIKEGTWLIANATEDIIFNANHKEIWKKSIELLGEKYSYLAHIPTDPQLN